MIESQGRAFPVETRYLGRDPARADRGPGRPAPCARPWPRRPAACWSSCRARARSAAPPSRLAERAAATRRRSSPRSTAPWTPREQDRAIAPAPAGRRKVVLATSIAETSLTIEGVRVVIDCGLAARAALRSGQRPDPAGDRAGQPRRRRPAPRPGRAHRAGRLLPPVGRAGDPRAAALRRPGNPGGRPVRPGPRPGPLGRAGRRRAWPSSTRRRPAPSPRRGRCWSGWRRWTSDGALTAHGAALARPAAAAAPGPHGAGGRRRRARPRAPPRIAALLTERGLGGTGRRPAPPAGAVRRATARPAPATPARWPTAGPGRRAARAGRGRSATACCWPPPIPSASPRRAASPASSGWPAAAASSSSRTDALAREPWLAVGELGGGAARDRILLAAPLDAGRAAGGLRRPARRPRTGWRPTRDGRLRAKRADAARARSCVEERLVDKPDPAADRRAPCWTEVRARGPGGPAVGRGGSRPARPASPSCARWTARPGPTCPTRRCWRRLDDWLAPLLAGALGAGRSSARRSSTAPCATLIPWELQRRLDARGARRASTAPDRHQRRHRLRRRGRAAGRGAGAGAVRPGPPPDRRRRPRPADPGAAVAGAPADPGDQGPAGLLDRARGRTCAPTCAAAIPGTPGRRTRWRPRRPRGPSRAGPEPRPAALRNSLIVIPCR